MRQQSISGEGSSSGLRPPSPRCGGEKALAIYRRDNKGSVGGEKALAIYRRDNKGSVGGEKALAIYRPDNKGAVGGEEALAIYRRDNKGSVGGEKALAIYRRARKGSVTQPFRGAWAIVALFFLLLLAACRHESTLPKLFTLPDAALVSETGKPVRLAEMKGYVTVYDFIFTNCAGTCPMMTTTMRKLTPKIDKEAKVRFVSISVDPARDTPAVLRDYAARVRNDPRWLFLTGDQKTIVDLSVNGFKLAAGGATGSPNESILHSAKFAIADQNGVVRDYYGAENDDAVDHVVKVVRDLQ